MESIKESLSTISNKKLYELAITNSEVSELCKQEEIWKDKITYEYPSFINKPDDIRWNQYYRQVYLHQRIPVYYEGNIKSYVNFDILYANIILDQLTNKKTTINGIICLNQQLLPVLYITSEITKAMTQKDTDIRYIVYFDTDISNIHDSISYLCTQYESIYIINHLQIYIVHNTRKMMNTLTSDQIIKILNIKSTQLNKLSKDQLINILIHHTKQLHHYF